MRRAPDRGRDTVRSRNLNAIVACWFWRCGHALTGRSLRVFHGLFFFGNLPIGDIADDQLIRALRRSVVERSAGEFALYFIGSDAEAANERNSYDLNI